MLCFVFALTPLQVGNGNVFRGKQCFHKVMLDQSTKLVFMHIFVNTQLRVNYPFRKFYVILLQNITTENNVHFI